MILSIKKYIKWEVCLLFTAALLTLAACTPKMEFTLSGNDQTVSIYNLSASCSLKLSEEESENFIRIVNSADFEKVNYDTLASSDYSQMRCIFLNDDKIVYSVMQNTDDSCLFCIKTHEDELSDEKIRPSAYTFVSEELADLIDLMKETAVLPEGYEGEILSVDQNNTSIMLTSPDGLTEIELSDEWIFKKISSKGSDDPKAGALNYSELSSNWGNAIVFNTDGTGIMIHAYASESPVYEAFTWNYLTEGGRKAGLVYGNSGFSFILKFIGLDDGDPTFEMIDATGADNSFGPDYLRLTVLSRLESAVSFEHIIGIDISDIDEISINYRGHLSAISSADEIKRIIEALKSVKVKNVCESYINAERIYTFGLLSGGRTELTIDADDSGRWLGVGGNYYEISDPDIFLDAKSSLETHISFGNEPVENKDYIKGILNEITETNINRSEVRWSHFPKESYRVEHWQDEDFLEHWAYQEKNLSKDDIDYIITTLNETDFEILDKQPVSNTDFHIGLDFENGSVITLNADDSEIYASIRYNGEWIYLKVFHIGLFEYLLGFAGEGGFDTDVISAAKSITICYVKKADRKDYPENGMITEIKITDSETVEKIARAVAYDRSKTMTYPSRESSDIIFSTDKGDYYGKIKFPITTDENGISEPTIILQGYYWYSCEELYKILIEIEKAQ